jgi:3-deoxy-D-manno-octulosonate 8-phosphate phosphatase (KDO 8-P phosphatase)
MIKLLVLDVDGTLTDGGITHHSDGTESKTFSAKDGLILKVLPKLGIDIMILTGRDSPVTIARGEYLKIKYIVQGVDDKVAYLREFMVEQYLEKENAAYIGDDLNDYAAMQLCGFKACPADAAHEIKSICDYISSKNGGDGAVRDICEYLLKQQGKWVEFLSLFKINR